MAYHYLNFQLFFNPIVRTTPKLIWQFYLYSTKSTLPFLGAIIKDCWYTRRGCICLRRAMLHPDLIARRWKMVLTWKKSQDLTRTQSLPS